MTDSDSHNLERVVYLLGAGFSAGLGLPVMTDFLEKSKDLFFADSNRYAHFEKVYVKINEMSVSKNYYAADLFNIEEVLSILEMQRSLAGRQTTKMFTDFIADVIEAFTPEIPEPAIRASRWQDSIFSKETSHRLYGFFGSALQHLSFESAVKGLGSLSEPTICTKRLPPYAYDYSVVTLNYDVVLESYSDYSRTRHQPDNEFGFETGGEESVHRTQLAKLHGSVGDKSVVPPTWNKNLRGDIARSWRKALRLLREANHIRVIGYSLPRNDTYVRYLLKAAVVDTRHLKTFDVICRDRTGQVKHRYDEFVVFPNYRFSNGDVEDYLGKLYDAVIHDFERQGKSENPIVPRGFLQQVHDGFIKSTQTAA